MFALFAFMTNLKKLIPDMLFRLVLHVVLLASVALSKSSPLDVRLRTGVFRGVSTANGTETWLGIPFAAAPVGSRRFKAPVPLTHGPVAGDEPVKDASKFGNACPQPPSSALGAPVNEDCLFLNVWRPQNTSADAKLPILVWFHGGAYTTGAGSAPSADPTRILLRSVEIEKPIIFVSVNYRLNTYGFVSSPFWQAPSYPKKISTQDSLIKLRLSDSFNKILALLVVIQKKLRYGDKVRVPVALNLCFCSPSRMRNCSELEYRTHPPGHLKPRLPQKLTTNLGNHSRDCFKLLIAPLAPKLSIVFVMFLLSNAMIGATLNSQLWQPTISPGTKFRAQASEIIESGDFIHLPYLAGTNVNEGAGFSVSLRNRSLTGPAQDAAFDDFIARLLIDNSIVTEDTLREIHRLWAENDTTLGAPFNTGDSLFDRAAAWYTDEMYLAPRRLLFEHAAEKQDLFAYYFREFIPGNDPTLGVAHASELQLFFGPVPDVEVDFANTMTDFYINFVNDLNPGPEWPKYDLETRPVLQLLRGNVTVIPDDWDVDKTDFLNSEKVLREFQK